MKFLVLPALLFALTALADSYYPNDGKTAPGTFTDKSNDVMKTETKKAPVDNTIERQEEEAKTGTGSVDKPVLDSNPNDESYRVGPLNTSPPDN